MLLRMWDANGAHGLALDQASTPGFIRCTAFALTSRKQAEGL